MKKIMMVLIAVTFMATSSFAGEAPEFDVVGCDASNHFNDLVRQSMINNNWDLNWVQINTHSDFETYSVTYTDINGEEAIGQKESYYTSAGQEQWDPCFSFYDYEESQYTEYKSNLVTAWNGALFRWNIVLQKKPETDLNITIRDCVLKMNSFVPYGYEAFAGASQTGRYIMPWGQSMWVVGANPTITAKAYPGQYASLDFDTPFTLDGRTLPGLTTVSLEDAYYTSKGMFEESIVVVMPEDGAVNQKGELQYRLKQGDMISVTIIVPEAANTVNMNYGKDNVAINYVGIYGTDYVTEEYCR